MFEIINNLTSSKSIAIFSPLITLIFNLGKNDIRPTDDIKHPLYHFKNLIASIQDCIAFVLEYYIPTPEEIVFGDGRYQTKMVGIFNMILDIFKNELNTLLQPYFAFKLEKEDGDDKQRIDMIDMNKSFINVIKTNLEALSKASADGKLPDYSFISPSQTSPISSDLEMFDFINR